MRHQSLVTLLSLACAFGVAALASAAPAPKGKVRVYVGTYTGGVSKGIYRLELDLATGTLTPEGEPAETVNPSFLALHPSGRYLYAVNETGTREDKGGAVSAFAVDAATGALTFLNKQPSGGAAPCHLWLDKEGHHLLVANYSSGSVAVLPIGADGRLGTATSVVESQGENPTPRDPGTHAHSVHLDAAERFAFVADLGLDKVFVYRFDAGKGTLTPHTPPFAPVATGAGPRHFTFDRTQKRAYVIDELDSTVTAFDHDAARGTLTEIQAVPTLPADWKEKNSTAEVLLSPDGRFLYGSNRGHDSIAIFAVDASTGKLTPKGHQKTLGKTPRNFAIDPTGTFLLAANQGSDSVVVFRIDAKTGGLTAVGAPFTVPKPVCLRMVRK